MLRIRIRMDPELFAGSGSGIIVSDPDPAKSSGSEEPARGEAAQCHALHLCKQLDQPSF